MNAVHNVASCSFRDNYEVSTLGANPCTRQRKLTKDPHLWNPQQQTDLVGQQKQCCCQSAVTKSKHLITNFAQCQGEVTSPGEESHHNELRNCSTIARLIDILSSTEKRTSLADTTLCNRHSGGRTFSLTSLPAPIQHWALCSMFVQEQLVRLFR